MKNENASHTNLISRLARQGGFWLIPLTFAFASLALLPEARAICHEDCTNSNTAIGAGAFINNITGDFNTAIGFRALFGNIFGNDNTAVGTVALQNNTSGFYNTAVGVLAL